MNYIDYDFSSFNSAFESLKNNITTPDILNALKIELNRFFNDSKCKEVLYTTNIDHMFFGIKILPIIDADDVYDYISEEDQIRIDNYIVELDSKLFNPVIDLTSKEFTALLIREVSSMVGDSEPMENARNALNIYLASNGTVLKVSQSIHYKEILAYGLKDYLSKCSSIFYIENIEDAIYNDMLVSYGLANDIESAYKKLRFGDIKIYENCEISKFITFSWTLDLYKHIRTRRIGALHTLSTLKTLTGSRLEKLEMDNVIRRIQRIDDDSVLMESSDTGIRAKIKSKLRKARLNNLRMIDSTYYEMYMQVKNIEDENDALFLMRQINNSISIIDEYRNSKDCDPIEIEKWNQVYDKFFALRNKLTDTVVYKNKQYGLFVNYPEIVENRY